MHDHTFLNAATESVANRSAEIVRLRKPQARLGIVIAAIATAATMVFGGTTPAMAQAVRSAHDVSSAGIIKAHDAAAPDIRVGNKNVVSLHRAGPNPAPGG